MMAELKRRLFGGYTSESVEEVLSEKEALLNGASKEASVTEQLESVSSQLAETQRRLAELESQLAAAQELSTTLTADLQGSVAQRESLEAEVLPLRSELAELRNAQAERLEQAPPEMPGSEESLQRALDEAAEYKATVIAQQQRMTELEHLVEGYRELIESETPIAAPPAKPSDEEEPPTPKTANELAAVIEAAEQAVANILDSTRVRADKELRAVDDERERIERDIESMTSWRDRAAPMIASLQAALDEIKIQAVEIGRGIDEALRPVATAVATLTAQLASLDDLARAPVESTEAPAPSEDDSVTVIPEEHPPSPDFQNE
jgi:DNA repair exonuclease SbcCD ATPase subunit